MADTNGTPDLPGWFYLARAILTTGLGVVMLFTEAVGDGPGRIVVIAAALLLLGFPLTDILAFARGRAGGQG